VRESELRLGGQFAKLEESDLQTLLVPLKLFPSSLGQQCAAYAANKLLKGTTACGCSRVCHWLDAQVIIISN